MRANFLQRETDFRLHFFFAMTRVLGDSLFQFRQVLENARLEAVELSLAVSNIIRSSINISSYNGGELPRMRWRVGFRIHIDVVVLRTRYNGTGKLRSVCTVVVSHGSIKEAPDFTFCVE